MNRSRMRRQLYSGGGITSVPRVGFGLGSSIKKRLRKLIPNEIADVAVKAAPLVAMVPGWGPTAAGLMRGIGRFDQRGSISDALKQGIGTYAGGKLFGKGMEGMGWRDQGASGIREFINQPTKSRIGGFFGRGESNVKGKVANVTDQDPSGLGYGEFLGTAPTSSNTFSGGAKNIWDTWKGMSPGLRTAIVGTGSGAIAGFAQWVENQVPQEPGESIEEWEARRSAVVGDLMLQYLDNTRAFDAEWTAKTDEQKKEEIAKLNLNQGGRVGYQAGGTMMDLVENISDPGSPYYEAAKTLQDRKAQNEAALNLLNTTGTSGTTPTGGDYVTLDEYEDYRRKKAYDPINAPGNVGRSVDEIEAGIADLVSAASKDPDSYLKNIHGQFDDILSNRAGTATPTGEAGGIITDGNIKYRINADGSRTPIGGINVGGTTFYENAQGRGPGTYDTYDGTTFTAADNYYEMEKDMADKARGAAPEVAPQRTAAPEVAPQRTIAPTIKAEPEGIETIPTSRRVFSYAPEEEIPYWYGDTSIAETGDYGNQGLTSPMTHMGRTFEAGERIQSLPGMFGGMGQNLLGNISMDKSLRENRAINEAQRLRNFDVRQAARSKLPGYGPAPVMPMQNTNPDAGLSGQQIAEKYNIPYNQGGRVGLHNGGAGIEGLEDRLQTGAPRIIYEGDMRPNRRAKGGRIGYATGTTFEKWLQGKQKFDIEQTREQLYKQYLEDMRRQKVAEQKQSVAQGGRIGYRFGPGPVMDPRGLRGLPGIPRMAPDGMEYDMSQNGGFQPLGAKEGKDDIKANLAKNEFVFTADAVRGAGGGDIELGAQKMYDTMKNLEKRVV